MIRKISTIIFFLSVCADGTIYSVKASLKEPEKPLVIVIPSYNNKRWYKQNLDSALNQNYTNFRVIYIDDASNDGTGKLVQKYLETNRKKDKVTLIQNKQNERALYNLYHAIHSCRDDEIILTLDGDDTLAHNNVLSVINSSYQNPDIWLTYGQYREMPRGRIGHCRKFPEEIVKNNAFRKYDYISSQLRTFYAWLFKKIKKEDLQYKRKFFPTTYDVAIMYPMLEMAGERHRCIREVLYNYNYLNPLNDFRVNKQSQHEMGKIIAQSSSYNRLSGPPDGILVDQKNT